MEDPFPIKLIISHPAGLGKAGRSQKSRRGGSHEPSMHLLFASKEAFNTCIFISRRVFESLSHNPHSWHAPMRKERNEGWKWNWVACNQSSDLPSPPFAGSVGSPAPQAS